MKQLLLTCASLLVLSAAASAADLPTRKEAAPPPPMVAPWNWTGFYAGLNVGGGWESSSMDIGPIGGPVLGTTSASGNSFLIGGRMGYRSQLASGVVLGAEGTLEAGPGHQVTSNLATMTTDARLSASLAGQLGLAMGDVLPYAFGGASWGSAPGNLVVGAPFNINEDTNASAAGWFLGAGIDYHLWNNWILSAQYKYTSWNTFNYNFQNAGAFFNDNVKSQAAYVGLSYKF